MSKMKVKSKRTIDVSDMDLNEISCIVTQLIMVHGSKIDWLEITPGEIKFNYYLSNKDLDENFGEKNE